MRSASFVNGLATHILWASFACHHAARHVFKLHLQVFLTFNGCGLIRTVLLVVIVFYTEAGLTLVFSSSPSLHGLRCVQHQCCISSRPPWGQTLVINDI